MPRLYADVPTHNMNWGSAITLINGVGAIPADGDTEHWTRASYAIDSNKNRLSPFDVCTLTELRAIADYLKVAYTAETTKQALVRGIETALDAFKTTLTVASVAGTASGASKITVTGMVGTAGNKLAYKTAQTTAPVVLYMDEPAWTALTNGADIAPTAAHDKITVVELNSAGQVVSVGTATITKKA